MSAALGRGLEDVPKPVDSEARRAAQMSLRELGRAAATGHRVGLARAWNHVYDAVDGKDAD